MAERIGKIRIHYSQEADALYIRLKETDIKNSDEVTDGVIMDYDAGGNIVGIEILSASQKADVHQLNPTTTLNKSVTRVSSFCVRGKPDGFAFESSLPT